MPFQFYCPQGHLLEGHESQMGQQSQCPLCGMVFLIPTVPQQGAPQQNFPQQQMVPQQPPAQQPAMPHLDMTAPESPLANLGAAAPPARGPEPPPQNVVPPPPAEPAPPPKPEPAPEPRVVRIPCPKGHVLETPSDMFGQQALCPYCNTQFELRFEDSIEYQEELAEAKRRHEEKINQLWVTWSIRAAIFVVVMLIGMVLWMTVIGPWLNPPPPI